MNGMVAVHHFEADLLAAENNAQRVAVARQHLARLLPDDPVRAARTEWQYVYLGYGRYGTRFALIETEIGKPGARLLVLRGLTLLSVKRMAGIETARRAAFAYEWAQVENVP